MKIFGGINKIIFMIIGISLMTDAYSKNDLQVGWDGYWPGVVGKSGNTAPQIPPIEAAPAPMPVQSMPVINATPPQPIITPSRGISAPINNAADYEEPAPQRIKRTPILEPRPSLIPRAQSISTPIPQPAAASPVAPVAAVPQVTGGPAAMAGIGAAFAALGAMGASSQKNEPSRMNQSMMMQPPRTATEHFNCVGKPPQQCQQEWENLVQKIESMPGARILSKTYGCGPNAPGMMQTGPYHPGMPYPHPGTTSMGHPGQQPYGGMQGYSAPGMAGQPIHNKGHMTGALHGLTGLLRR